MNTNKSLQPASQDDPPRLRVAARPAVDFADIDEPELPTEMSVEEIQAAWWDDEDDDDEEIERHIDLGGSD